MEEGGAQERSQQSATQKRSLVSDSWDERRTLQGRFQRFKIIFCIVRLMWDPGSPDQLGAPPGEFQDLPKSEEV